IPQGFALQIQCYQCEEFQPNDCSSPEFIVNCTVNVQNMCQKEVMEKSDGLYSVYTVSIQCLSACLVSVCLYSCFCLSIQCLSACLVSCLSCFCLSIQSIKLYLSVYTVVCLVCLVLSVCLYSVCLPVLYLSCLSCLSDLLFRFSAISVRNSNPMTALPQSLLSTAQSMSRTCVRRRSWRRVMGYYIENHVHLQELV
ncbi:Hypothetical predicted protein, partial [Pelobates cultripes]